MSRTPVESDAATATVATGDFINFNDISDNNSQKKVSVTNLLAANSVANAVGTVTRLRCTTQTDATTTTLAAITGLTGATVVVGTYLFSYRLVTTCGGTGGTKVAFKLNTTVLGVINYTTRGMTASAVAVANGTTATDQTSQIASNTAAIFIEGSGSFTVTTGGTIDLQFAENSANSTSSVLVGSDFVVTRIA